MNNNRRRNFRSRPQKNNFRRRSGSLNSSGSNGLNNNGNMYRDMTFIDDIIDGILKAIDFVLKPESKNKNEIFNLGNDSPVKVSNMLHELEHIIGKKALFEPTFTKNEAFKTHADITKAKNLLGYDPKVCFEEGIERFLDWHRNYENI